MYVIVCNASLKTWPLGAWWRQEGMEGEGREGEGRRGEGGQLNIHQTSMGLNIRPNIWLLMKAVFA